MSVVGPGDELSPEQLTRVLEAVAILGAKREAYRAGMSPAQVDTQTWLVEVDPLDSSVV